MRSLASALPLLREVGEAGGFAGGAAGHVDLVIRGYGLVEEAGHRSDQPAAGYFEFRSSDGLRSGSARDRGHLLQAQRFGDNGLAGIFANRIVRDEPWSGLASDGTAPVSCAVGLRIQ